MNAYYERVDGFYIVHLGVLCFRVPIDIKFYGRYVELDDELMDILISRYDNDCLEWRYNGEVVSEGRVGELSEELGVVGLDLLDYFDLCVKD